MPCGARAIAEAGNFEALQRDLLQKRVSYYILTEFLEVWQLDGAVQEVCYCALLAFPV